MQADCLSRLSEPVQRFVREVEHRTGIDIRVVLDKRLNNGGPFGNGILNCASTHQRPIS